MSEDLSGTFDCPIPPLPENEEERLSALDRYHILDTAPERHYDDITAVAALIFGASMATVSLVDRTRQWFKSKRGLSVDGTPRDLAFCAYTVHKARTMVVRDMLEDPRFRNHGLVTGSPHIRFYAGAPLITPDGYALGSLCVIDTVPRDPSPEQVAALESLAALVVSQMQYRLVCEDLAEALKNVKILGGMLPICAECKSIRDDDGYWRRVEAYMNKHAGADFIYEICPACATRHNPLFRPE